MQPINVLEEATQAARPFQLRPTLGVVAVCLTIGAMAWALLPPAEMSADPRSRVRTSLATLALSAIDHKLASGQYPSRLDELLARRVQRDKRWYEDPWGREYRLLASEMGCVIYTLGADGGSVGDSSDGDDFIVVR